MKNKLITVMLSMLMFSGFSYAEGFLIDNTAKETNLIDISDDDFYYEPKEIVKGKENPSGFAQLNTKQIPLKYQDQNYIELMENEVERLKELPDTEDYILKGKALPVLKYGSKGESVETLLKGLVANGFLEQEAAEQIKFYDQNVVNSVREAQEYYGIGVDGVAGKEVYRNLFIDKQERINQLQNWISQVDDMIEVGRSENKPFVVIVNVPSFTLHVIETNNKTEILQSKIIVGKATSKTPIYRANLSGLKYYPTWNPPMSVVKRNVLPNMALSGSMRIVNSRGATVPISSVTRNDILTGKYSVQQTPGVHNSLGILKFETDSTDAIYLHDTNNRSLFNKKSRALSLGCVRVQQWPELAALIANSDENYIFNNINKKRTYIQKTDKIPLFYTYSLVDNVEGKVGHYNDIYKRGE